MHPGRAVRTGFTLLETLLAVFLSAMLVLLVGAAINFYVRFVDARRNFVARSQIGRAVLGRIADDLRGAWYPATETSKSEEISGDLADTESLDADTLVEAEEALVADLATTAVPSVVGLYGNQYQLQVDVVRDPHPARYDALLAAGIDPRQANVSSEVKTIAYYVRDVTPDELSLWGAVPDQAAAAAVATERAALIRRVQQRADLAAINTTGTGIATASDGSAGFAGQAVATQAGGPLTNNPLAGQAGNLQVGEQLLAEEIPLIEFLYFDGLDWYPDWDSQMRGGLPMAVSIAVSVRRDDATPWQDGASQNVPVGSQSSLSEPVEVFRLTVHLPTAQPTYESLLGTTDTTGDF
jgi:hypothetical protein